MDAPTTFEEWANQQWKQADAAGIPEEYEDRVSFLWRGVESLPPDLMRQAIDRALGDVVFEIMSN